MAPLWLTLSTVLSSPLLTGSYALPALQLLGQDGTTSGAAVGAHALPATTDSLPVASQRWERKAAGGGAQGSPQLPRRKRQAGGRVPSTARAPLSSSEPVGAQDGPHLADQVGTVVSRGSSGTATVAFSETGNVSVTTEQSSPSSETTVEYSDVSAEALRPDRTVGTTSAATTTTEWPWLDDISTESDNSSVSTANLTHGFDTTRPGPRAKGKSGSPHTTATATTTTEWPWLGDFSTESSELDNSSVSTANLTHGLDATRPGPRAKGKSGSPHTTATATTTTEWPWLDDFSTESSELDNSSVSTANLTHGLDATRPGSRAKGKSGSPHTPARASTAATQANLPSAVSPLVGKCLLAIFLLALVAAIFMVTTAVLATLLWRQKRAYKMNQQNHTEMVCISSLLAAEEVEEAAGRAPQVKRVRLLGENGSEAEMDNLTLNSFLPDH